MGKEGQVQHREGLHPRYAVARKGLSRILDRYLPNRVVDSHDALGRVEELAQQGYGLLLLCDHLTASDQIRVGKETSDASHTLKRVKFHTPISHHHNGLPLKGFTALMGFADHDVVTANTRESKKKGLHPTQRVGAFMGAKILPHLPGKSYTPEELKERNRLWESRDNLEKAHGLREFYQEAGEAIYNGEVVLYSPLGERSPDVLGKPRGKSLERIITAAREAGAVEDENGNRVLPDENDLKIAVMFVGVNPRGRGPKYNIGRKYILTYNKVLLLPELRAYAIEERITLEQAAFNKLAEVSRENAA